jgi:hypothetical protein
MHGTIAEQGEQNKNAVAERSVLCHAVFFVPDLALRTPAFMANE